MNRLQKEEENQGSQSKTTTKYRPRMRRVTDELPPFRLTARDLEILKALQEYQLLTCPQITRLVFGNMPSGANKCAQRLQKLYHHEYVERVDEPSRVGENKPFLYALTKISATALAQNEGIDVGDIWNPKQNTVSDIAIKHLKLLNDIAISIVISAKELGYEIVESKNTAELQLIHNKNISYVNNGKVYKSRLYPDRYYCVKDKDGYRFWFFIEADTGTEAIKSAVKHDLYRKLLLYRSLQDSGAFSRLYGGNAFRVLFVTTGKGDRAENVLWLCEKLGEEADFIYVTLDSNCLAKNLFTDKIWGVAFENDLLSLMDFVDD